MESRVCFLLRPYLSLLILMPDRDTPRESAPFLGEIVKEINDSTVEAEEVLSDSVYYYDGAKDEFRFCSNH